MEEDIVEIGKLNAAEQDIVMIMFMTHSACIPLQTLIPDADSQ